MLDEKMVLEFIVLMAKTCPYWKPEKKLKDQYCKLRKKSVPKALILMTIRLAYLMVKQ